MAAKSGITVEATSYQAAVTRYVQHSKKAGDEALKSLAKRLWKRVAEITPPAGAPKEAGNANAGVIKGRAAEKVGRAAIVRDVTSIYGQPGRAYSDLQRKSTQARADAFWAAYKEGRNEAAGKIIRADLKKSFSPFDGGKLARRRLGKKKLKEPIYYVRQPQSLSAYIQERQSRVWYLASGWKAGLLRVGAKGLPYGVNKKSGPGVMRHINNNREIVYWAINQVKYGSRLDGLEVQYQSAMRYETESLEREWQAFLKKLEGGRRK